MIRLAIVTAAALTSAAAVAGCASSSSTTQPAAAGPSASSATSAPAASDPAASAGPASSSPGQAGVAPAACAARSLRVTLGTGQGGYAGGVDAAINFTNTSSAPCALLGFPGVSLVDPNHSQIGLAAKRTSTSPVKTVTLGPGVTAHAALQIVDAQNYPSAVCPKAKAAALRVFPPGQTAAVYLPSSATGCNSPVPILYVSSVRPGSG